MGLSDIAKAPVSHGVEPHDLETGPALRRPGLSTSRTLLLATATARAVSFMRRLRPSAARTNSDRSQTPLCERVKRAPKGGNLVLGVSPWSRDMRSGGGVGEIGGLRQRRARGESGGQHADEAVSGAVRRDDF